MAVVALPEGLSGRSALNDEIREIIDEEGLIDNDEITSRLLREGPQFFLRLAPQDQFRMVRNYVVSLVGTERRRTHFDSRRVDVETDGVVQSMIRIAPRSTHYWSSIWHIDGVAKTTRELSKKDIEWLVQAEYRNMREAKARVVWLMEVLKLARKNKAETLGDLEKKGIDLPTIEMVEEEEN